MANLFRAVVNSIGASSLVPRPVRWIMLRAYGIDARAWNIRERCFFGGRNITIGRGSFINQGCVFDNLGAIRIGERCAIGMEVMFAASTHELGSSVRRAGSPRGGDIVIEDGCWIGARVVLLPGTLVEAGSVVAAGAVVTGTVAADSVFGGVPARKLRDLPPFGTPRIGEGA
jgi:maltose O-acetyltransferase